MRNIASERARYAMTQQELADEMGVTRVTISRWETGRNAPTTADVCKMANIFDCSVDYLLARTDERK